jgi:hypothetical protein
MSHDLDAILTRAGLCLGLKIRKAGPQPVIEDLAPLSGTQEAEGATWSVSHTVAPVNGRTGCVDVVVRIACTAGAAAATVVEVRADAGRWSKDNYVFAPAMIYASNRFDALDIPYSPYWPDASHYAVDKPTSFTNQPRLPKDGSPGAIELDSASLATPCIGFRSVHGTGALIFGDLHNELGVIGMGITEHAAAGRAQLIFATPRARSKIPTGMGFREADTTRDWKAGEAVTLRLRLWTFAAPELQTLFDRFAEARKDYGTRTWTHDLPFSEAANLVRAKLNALNWDEWLGYYRHGIDKTKAKPFDWFQLGWVSGGVTTLPMLSQGDALSQARARRNLDFMFTQLPLPNGLWCAHHDGVKVNYDDPRPPRPGYLVSVRRMSDGLYYGMKQIRILAERGEAVPKAWEDAARGLADAFIRLFNRYGQIGQYLDVRNATIGIGGSTAAGGVPAGLALVAKHFNEPAYLGAAIAIGRHLVETSLEKGLTNGGPCDALAAPDSESCAAFLMSLVDLHQATGHAYWAKAASDLIRQYSSWVTSYDFPWPKGSALERRGAPATGTVWANVQNKHTSAAICAYSGEQLFRHWRTTGDELALDLILDTAHNMTHHVSLADKPLGPMGPGMMCERINMSDWEGPNTIGDNVFGSTIWVETSMLLTAAEIPSVYLRSDTGRVVVFDHLEAAWAGGVLTVTNPTRFPATAHVLCETSAQAAKPLGVNLLQHCQRVEIAPGASVTLKP